MPTALVTHVAPGALQLHYAVAQTAYDTMQAFVAADGVRMTELKIEPTKNYMESEECAGTASLVTEVAGKRGGKWSAALYCKPNAAGTPPDCFSILKAAFGVETTSGGVSDTFSLSDATIALSGLQLQRLVSGVAQDIASGAWVESLDWEITGGQLPKIAASGGFAYYARGSQTGVAAAGAVLGASVVPLVAGQDGSFTVGAVLEFISGTTHYNNTGAGYTVTTVTPSATVPTITVSPVLEHAVVENDLISPYAPTPSVSGTILDGVQCSLTIDTVSLGFVKAKITHKTGVTGMDKEATADRANRLVFGGKRRIEGDVEFYFLDTVNGPLLGKAWDGALHDFVLRIGPASTPKITLTWYGRVEVAPLNVPGADLATYSAKFKCRMKSSACDEFNVVFA